MKSIRLTSKPNSESWEQRFVDDGDYDRLFDEDVSVMKPNGDPLLVLLKNGLSRASVANAWPVLHRLNLKSRNRGTAAGRKNELLPASKKDGGTRSGRTLQSPAGWDVFSGTIGYFGRSARLPYCRACSWNEKHPAKFQRLFPMLEEASHLFEKHVPARFATQKSFVEKTDQAYVIPGTVYTTLTVNKNFRTACHLDAGDLEAGFSCMTVIRSGSYMGGNLVLPNWRVAVRLDTADLILFDAHEYHGNTQIVPLTKDAQRCSVVMYYRENILECLPPADELLRAKNRRPGDALY